MLVAGGAVVMQDAGSSYNHSSGSFKTENGGFENIFPVGDDAEDTPNLTTDVEGLVVGTRENTRCFAAPLTATFDGVSITAPRGRSTNRSKPAGNAATSAGPDPSIMVATI